MVAKKAPTGKQAPARRAPKVVRARRAFVPDVAYGAVAEGQEFPADDPIVRDHPDEFEEA